MGTSSTPNLLKYSNGWGHLIMSLALLATGIILILMHDSTFSGIGIGLISSVAGYWFVSSSINQAVKQSTPVATGQATTAPTTGGINGSTS